MSIRFASLSPLVLLLCLSAATAAPLTIEQTEAGWSVSADGRAVLTYNYGAGYPKPWIDPLVTPAGHTVVVTSPPDHVHHRGLMFAWGNIVPAGEPEGYHLIFWGEEGDPHTLGRIVPDPAQAPVVSETADGVSIVTHDLWLRNSDDLLVLRERREVRVHESTDERGYLVTWTTEQTPVMDIKIGPTPGRDVSYYGLGIRSAPDMDLGLFVNSNARREVAGVHGDRAEWLAYQGLADPVRGFAIMDHPDNPRYPTGWFAMNDFGYITASLPAFTEYPLNAGQTLKLTYGALVFDGAIDPEYIDGQYDHWLEMVPAQNTRSTIPLASAAPVVRNGEPVFSLDTARPTLKPSYAPVATPQGYNVSAPTNANSHHHGLWFTWGKILLTDGAVDFWGEAGDREAIGQVTTESLARTVDDGAVEYASRHLWQRASGGEPFISEDRVVRVEQTASEATLITFHTEQTALQDLTLSAECHEPSAFYGLALQMTSDMNNGLVVNANGSQGRQQIEGEPANWCAYATDVQPARGVALFDHPLNPRHPSSYFTLPSGFLSASLVAHEDYVMAQGDVLALTYGILVFDGAFDDDDIDAAYRRWTRLQLHNAAP